MAQRPAGALDAKGCLTPAGVRLLQQAPPGGGPPELAAHVARCARCQERVLAQDLGGEARPPARKAPPLWRALLIFGVGFLLALAAVAIAARLQGAG
ncbi:MAG: hypothetical protein AB7O37_18410 [Vicinamibacteria bacterium]